MELEDDLNQVAAQNLPTSPEGIEHFLTPGAIASPDSESKGNTRKSSKRLSFAVEVSETPFITRRSSRSLNAPYPSQALLKNRMKSKVGKRQNDFDTPNVRRRIVSDTNRSFNTSKAPTEKEEIQHKRGFECIRLEEEGTHDCSTAGVSLPIHLEHNLFEDDSEKQDISTAVLEEIKRQNTHKASVSWTMDEIERMDGLFKETDYRPSKEHVLLHVLGVLNMAASKTDPVIGAFTGLKISC